MNLFGRGKTKFVFQAHIDKKGGHSFRYGKANDPQS
jgi:hypothetical protein